MLKIIAIAGILIVAVVFASMPIQAFTLSVLLSFNDNYDMMFSPTYFISQIPRYSLWSSPDASVLRRYDFFGIDSVYLDINATAWNINGTIFFDGRVILNTVAEQKILFLREYQSELYTNNLTLSISAYLFVDLVNGTDIERDFSGEWNLVIPF